jgi:phosphoglycolate phosphatase
MSFGFRRGSRATAGLALVFDLDGTLIESAADLHAAAAVLFAERGLVPLDLATVTSFIGHGIPRLVERCLAAAGTPLPEPELGRAVGRFTEIYAASPAVLARPYPGVRTALSAFTARGIPLAVCTNKAEAISRKMLEVMDLSGFFALVIGGDTLAVRKPDPEVVHACARGLGVGRDRLCFVGDSETDAATAAAAKIPFVLFTKGYRKAAIREIVHAERFDDWLELPALIARLAR